MNAFFSRAWAMSLLLGLVAIIFLKGVVPAVSMIDADFPGYFTAARIVADGQDTARLYDDAWFQQQMRRYGLESAANPGKFAPFPPPTALLFVPLARLEPLAALRIAVAASVMCLVGSIFMLARILGWSRLDSALFVLLSGTAILTTLRFGQPYIVVSTFCVLGYYLYLQRRPWLAGLCFGLFVPLKYFPVVILACFALWKQWRVVLGGILAIAGVALVSVAVLGWQIHQTFLAKILGNHLLGQLSLADQGPPFTAVYQSFDTMFNRLFVFDPSRNPSPAWAAPRLAIVAAIATKSLLVLAAVAALAKLARERTSEAIAPFIGMLGILLLLIAPATATYMCVLLWLPVALLISYMLARGGLVSAYFVLGAWAAIGFIPYNVTYAFEGRGALTVLAYPRLFLLLAVFICCARALTRAQPSTRPEAALIV